MFAIRVALRTTTRRLHTTPCLCKPPPSNRHIIKAPKVPLTETPQPKSKPNPRPEPEPEAKLGSRPVSAIVRRALFLGIVTLQLGTMAHLFMEYGFQTANFSGASMIPTFEVYGDAAVIDCRFRRGRGVRVGDLVAFSIPDSTTGARGVKRVLGMPGDYVLLYTPGAKAGGDDPPMIQLPQGHCWLVGDNLDASKDSRYHGPIPLALIIGKVIAKHTPWSERRWIENPLDNEDGIVSNVTPDS